MTHTMNKWLFLPYAVIVWSVLSVLWWSVNRIDPVVIIEQLVVPEGRPGEQIEFMAKVVRDFSPSCELHATRYVVSANGYRYIIDELHLNATALEELTKGNPQALMTTMTIPSAIKSGPAQLLTYLRYFCNPLDKFWPIETVTELHFTVLEPK